MQAPDESARLGLVIGVHRRREADRAVATRLEGEVGPEEDRLNNLGRQADELDRHGVCDVRDVPDEGNVHW